MITERQFLDACDIIRQYRQQIIDTASEVLHEGIRVFPHGLKRGDQIVFEVVPLNVRNVTIGKVYDVIFVSPGFKRPGEWGGCFTFRNDNGVLKRISERVLDNYRIVYKQ